MGDLSTYDMRDWSLLDCDLTGVSALPTGKRMGFIYSRSTDWPIGIIPDDIELHNPDLASAWLRQRAPQMTGQLTAVAMHCANYALGNYAHSSLNTIFEIKTEFGIDEKAAALAIVAPAPIWLKEAERYVSSTAPPPIQDLTTNLTAVTVIGDRDNPAIDITASLAPPERDRWVLSRRLEADFPTIRFYVLQQEPVVTIFACHRRVGFGTEAFWFASVLRRML